MRCHAACRGTIATTRQSAMPSRRPIPTSWRSCSTRSSRPRARSCAQNPKRRPPSPAFAALGRPGDRRSSKRVNQSAQLPACRRWRRPSLADQQLDRRHVLPKRGSFRRPIDATAVRLWHPAASRGYDGLRMGQPRSRSMPTTRCPAAPRSSPSSVRAARRRRTTGPALVSVREFPCCLTRVGSASRCGRRARIGGGGCGHRRGGAGNRRARRRASPPPRWSWRCSTSSIPRIAQNRRIGRPI